MKSIVNRLKEYLDYKSISVSVAEKEINISNASLSKPFKNNTAIKTDTLEKFLIIYSDINPVWLLTGKGSITKSILKNEVVQDQTNFKELAEARLEIIEMLKEKIEELKRGMIPAVALDYDQSVKKGTVEFLNEPQLGSISGKKG